LNKINGFNLNGVLLRYKCSFQVWLVQKMHMIGCTLWQYTALLIFLKWKCVLQCHVIITLDTALIS
jgi:serine acetyltransferase